MIRFLDKIDRFCRWVDWRFILCGDELPYGFLQCIDRIKRIFAYAPVLWRDHDFTCDPGIFALMKKKLEMLEPQLTRHLYAERDKKRIRLCIILLDKVINCTYANEFHDKHDAKWGKSTWRFEQCEDNPEFSTLHFDRRNVRTEEEMEQERNELMTGAELAQRKQQKATDLVMRIVANYATGWWD
jgi:hypothetical protein